jgi:NTP pyrophosphatase (non-canonical NTP hydrolase)
LGSYKYKEIVRMHVDELITLQERFDRRHGWTLKTNNVTELIEMLHKDVVGLIGEVGEFANILKKLTLIQHSSRSSEAQNAVESTKNRLSEELIDVLIYLLRIAAYLHIDVEKAYLSKLELNEERYKGYEI